jgi:dipicolinate synthase subunit A
MEAQYIAAVVGGDARLAYAVQTFICAGWQVQQYRVPVLPGVEAGELCESVEEALDGASIVLGPAPFRAPDGQLAEELGEHIAKGQTLIAGGLPQALKERCAERCVPAHDLLEREDYTVLGAIATAEGAIAEAIMRSGGTIHLSDCLILGYGRCAKPLAKKLMGLDARVVVAVRRWEAACAAIADGCEVLDFTMLPRHIFRFAYIFNTIPAMVLDGALLGGVSPESTIIDIAAAPGGLDSALVEELGLNAKLCPGLPGKYSSRAAGESVAQTARIIMEEQEGATWGWNKYAPESE